MHKCVLSLYFLFFFSLCFAELSFEWKKTNPVVGLGKVRGVVQYENLTVMLQQGDLYDIYFSLAPDVDTLWERGNVHSNFPYTPSDAKLYSLGNDKYIILDSGNSTFTSSNGIDFYQQILNVNVYNPVMILNGGKPVFIASDLENTGLLISNDGINWKNVDVPAEHDFYLYFATQNAYFVSGNYYSYFTTDGMNWKTINITGTFGKQYDWAKFMDGNIEKNEIIAFVYAKNPVTKFSIFYSTDQGASWQVKNDNYDGIIITLFYFNNYYGIIYLENTSRTQIFQISKDLITFSTVSSFPQWILSLQPDFYSPSDILFVSSETGFVTTHDYNSWHEPDFGFTQYLTDFYTLNNGEFILGSDMNLVNRLFIGLQFYETSTGKSNDISLLSSPPFSSYSKIGYNKTGAYQFYYDNNVYSTFDFLKWEKTTIQTPTNVYVEQVLNENSDWVLISINNNVKHGISIYHSQDVKGNSWEKIFSSGKLDSFSGASGNGLFVILLDGVVRTSSDGVNWQHPITVDNSSLVQFVGEYFFINNPYPVLKSLDGMKWTSVSLPFSGQIYSYIASLKLYVATGKGQIATSSDLENWQISSLPSSYLIKGVGFNGKIWMAIDGYAGIYVSPNNN